MAYCVYMHVNALNGKKYIGITKNKPSARWGYKGKRYEACPYFYRAIQKYGWDNFFHVILMEGLEEEDAKYFERLLIEITRSNDGVHGYNLTGGGDGCFHPSPELLKRLGEARSGDKQWAYGKHFTEEHRRRLSESHKGHKPAVYKRTEEQKEALRKMRLGTHMPAEAFEKRRKTIEGWSDEKKAEYHKHLSEAMRGEKHWNYGRHYDDAMRKKLSEAHKGLPGNRNKRVLCIETGVIYDSAKSAAEAIGKCGSAVRGHCRGRSKTCGGMHFKYIDDLNDIQT